MNSLDISTDMETRMGRRRAVAFALLAIVQSTLIFTIALIMIPLPIIAEGFALTEAEVLLLQVSYGLPFS